MGSQYPELDRLSLPVQLEMFKQTYKAKSLHEAKLAYRSMEHAVRLLFPQVLVLLKLLLVCPVSSWECECSFSGLRRLKTWLRATMAQSRLNHVSICHVHRERLDNVNVNKIAKLLQKHKSEKNYLESSNSFVNTNLESSYKHSYLNYKIVYHKCCLFPKRS